MQIVKVNDNEELSQKAAAILANTLHQKETPVLGLATGSTPERLYEILIEWNKAGKISFQHATTFNLDEYVGLSGDDSNSYQYFMNEKLFKAIDIKRENTNIPNGLTENPEQEAKNYDLKIEQAGNIDVQILGLGLNGHIGFNEPGSDFASRTHVVTLDESTREANARFFKDLSDVPKEAITMGIASIMDAKEIILLVHGDKKADILRKVVHGDVTNDVPASVLQRHPNVTVITDIEI